MTGAHSEPSEVGPVMTVLVDGAALGISIEQVDRITLATDVIPVPESIPEYLGLIAHDDAYVPLLALRKRPPRSEELVVIVQVRGEPVGLSIDEAGRIHSAWDTIELNRSESDPAPPCPGARVAAAAGQSFWWVDTDRLWERA